MIFEKRIPLKLFLQYLLIYLLSGIFSANASANQDKTVGGFANLAYNPARSVEGCVYQLTPNQLATMDHFMGYPSVKCFFLMNFFYSKKRYI